MEKGSSDKMMREQKTKVENTRVYNFPAYGISVTASSLEEAKEKLSKIINKK